MSTAESRRPSREQATAAVDAFLARIFGEVPPCQLYEDGDERAAEGKCGWAFWIRDEDTTSYVQEDLSIEWYGTRWTPGGVAKDQDDGD